MSQTARSHRLALAEGTQLSHYKLGRILGFGGFGITYEAKDLELKRKVAIKELLPSDFATRDGVRVAPKTQADVDTFQWALQRFMEEGRILAACDHESIVCVHEIFQANGTGYMVTDFLDGESLGDWLEKLDRTPSEDELWTILSKLMEGLEVVHENGYLHRDIKPENIIITRDGSPVLIDFGSARLAVGGKTRAMTAVLTPAYAPFEQYHESGNQGPWTDIYSLGAVMYRAMVGKAPPEAAGRTKAVDPLNFQNLDLGDFSSGFVDGVDVALSFEETHRPQTVGEWRECFENARKRRTALKKRTERLATGRQPNRRSGLLFAVVFASIAILGVGGWLAWERFHPPGDVQSTTARITYAADPPPKVDPVAGFVPGSTSPTAMRDLRQSVSTTFATIRSERDRADGYWIAINKETSTASGGRLTALRSQARSNVDEVERMTNQASANMDRMDELLSISKRQGASAEVHAEANQLADEMRKHSKSVTKLSDRVRKIRMDVANELASVAKPVTPPPDEPKTEPVKEDHSEAVKNYALAYLSAGDSDSGQDQLRFFANRARYFDYGYLGRDEIAEKLNAYNSRWTQRTHEILSEPHVSEIRSERYSVSLKARYYVSDGATRKIITGTNYFEIKSSRTDDAGFILSARIEDAEISFPENPTPVQQSPAVSNYEVVYAGKEGVTVRAAADSDAASLGAAFRQFSVPLVATGRTANNRWVEVRVRGWMVAEGTQTTYMKSTGNGTWSVQSSDGVLSMRAGTDTGSDKIAEVNNYVYVKQLSERYVDGKHWVYAELVGWMATRLQSSGKILMRPK